MDKIRIWFKNEWASKYIENVTNWEFSGDYLEITTKEDLYFVKTDTIQYLMIGSMEDENVQSD